MSEDCVRVAFVGDVMIGDSHHALGYGVRSLLRARGPELFATEELGRKYGADLMVGNLETPVVQRSPTGVPYLGDQQALTTLRDLGFDILSIANNHIDDYGLEIARETENRVSSSGMECVVEGRTSVIQVRGMQVAFVTACLVPTWSRPEPRNLADIVRDIRLARENGQTVFVLLHWGAEYVEVPWSGQERVAEELVKAGAAGIIGCHPHVPQAVQRGNKGAIVAYSLGNFLFDTSWWPATMQGLVLRVVVTRNGEVAGTEVAHIVANPTAGRVGHLTGDWESLRNGQWVGARWNVRERGQADVYAELARRMRKAATMAMRREILQNLARQPRRGWRYLLWRARRRIGSVRSVALDDRVAWDVGQ